MHDLAVSVSVGQGLGNNLGGWFWLVLCMRLQSAVGRAKWTSGYAVQCLGKGGSFTWLAHGATADGQSQVLFVRPFSYGC
jgi:hypothetical protein